MNEGRNEGSESGKNEGMKQKVEITGTLVNQ